VSTPIIPIKEFDAEMANTRKLLARVPSDKGQWKPHEKSFPLGHLAQLVSRMPEWIARTLREPNINLTGGAGYSYEKTEALLEMFDKGVADARAALESVTGAALDEPWSLMMGDRVLMTSPRGESTRGHLNHLIHHRGQLTVYLRLIEVPLSQVYGPTADDRTMPGQPH
jgi:uncharacterized damage-inducible protein DinB